MRFHQQQKNPHSNLSLSPLMAQLGGIKALQINQHAAVQHFQQTSPNRFPAKAHSLADIPTSAAGAGLTNHLHPHHGQLPGNSVTPLAGGNPTNSSRSSNLNSGKRKRSWSRAVFSNLQRKGLEIQFQQQKYITKPDRRKLAARLNLTDAQVKVWFQNRRMKWRHTRENLKSGQEKQVSASSSQEAAATQAKDNNTPTPEEHREVDYSSDSSGSVEMSEMGEDDEIDVVE